MMTSGGRYCKSDCSFVAWHYRREAFFNEIRRIARNKKINCPYKMFCLSCRSLHNCSSFSSMFGSHQELHTISSWFPFHYILYFVSITKTWNRSLISIRDCLQISIFNIQPEKQRAVLLAELWKVGKIIHNYVCLQYIKHSEVLRPHP